MPLSPNVVGRLKTSFFTFFYTVDLLGESEKIGLRNNIGLEFDILILSLVPD